jgi:hypothetical protein
VVGILPVEARLIVIGGDPLLDGLPGWLERNTELGAGASSLFAEETKATFSQEKSAALKALTVQKQKVSIRIKEMVKKLFQ